jgi:hypothetical protein
LKSIRKEAVEMKRRILLIVVLLTSLLVVVSLVLLAAPVQRVQICHHNPDLDDGQPEWFEIWVAPSAEQAHLGHGDYLGACVVTE